MKSPFPGMDPYVEKNWRDIHASMMTYARDQLADQLPPQLVARLEERVVFETDDDESHHRAPDVHVVESQRSHSRGSAAVATATEDEPGPHIVVVCSEPMTETFVEIRDVENRKVVTVIELLSKTNKIRGDGLDQYRSKRQDLRKGKVNLVEIDLIRTGRRDLIWPMRQFPRKLRTLYLACVCRATKPGQMEVYPIGLHMTLPVMRIPLRRKDQDVKLDLQPLFQQAYQKGGYADTIDYRQPPDPPLEGAVAKWADTLLKKAGKR